MDIETSASANISNNGGINVNSSAQINGCSQAEYNSASAQSAINTSNQDGKLKFAYEKAIGGYNFHVERYNTWMNYYSLFTGAMFVGLCSIASSDNFGTPFSWFLVSIISLTGLISAICWWMSYTGYYAWLKSWINVVKKHEEQFLGTTSVYQFLADSKIENPTEFYPKYISTQKTTCIFIKTVVISWMATLVFMAYAFFNCCIALGLGSLLAITLLVILHCTINNKSGKYYSSNLSEMVKETSNKS